MPSREKDQQETLTGLSWGQRGAPLLPRTLRRALGEQRLPNWLLQESGLSMDATVEALGSEIWEAGLAALSSRIELYACRLLDARRSNLRDLMVFDQPWPLDLDPQVVPWTPRTRNCLGRSALIDEPRRLSRVTYGELFSIPQMGARSVLDFVVTSEMAIEQASGGSEISEKLLELVNRAIDAPWAELVSGEDPRFSDLLPKSAGTLADWLEDVKATPEAITTVNGVSAVASVLPSIFERIERIERCPLDLALREYISAASGFEGGRLDGVLERLGLDGEPARTLQHVADELQVSRERVRQLQNHVLARLPSHPVFMPALDRALQLVTQASPASAGETAKLLHARGISSVPFHPASLLAAARLCGRLETFEIERTPKGERVVTTPLLALAAPITLVASRQSDSFGASNLAELTSALWHQGMEIAEEQAREVLNQYSSAEFLNDDWFWMPDRSPNRNRLYNISRKILSVVSPMDVSTIRDGARRSYRFRGVTLVPPRDVMTAFYRAHPAFIVEVDGRVRSVDPLDYREELGKTEHIFVDVLRSSPTGVLERASFQEACEALGMNLSTFGVYTTYSAVLNHLGTDIWALRGVQVNPASVDALRRANASRPRERVIEDYGWNREGALWVAARVPRNLMSPVIGIPSSIAHYVANRHFPARAEDGSPAGEIGVSDNGSSWGYSPFLGRRGADEGDVLVIEFHLAAGEVVLRLGDVELLDDDQTA